MKPLLTLLLISAIMTVSHVVGAEDSTKPTESATNQTPAVPVKNIFWGKKKATASLAGVGVAGIAAWALAQNALSVTPHKRYRLNKHLAALGDAIKSEKDEHNRALLEQEKAVVTRKLSGVSKERTRLKVVRTLLALLAAASVGSAIYSYTQRDR